MTANAAEALEVALWLHRAPARREALLGRPLPEGIGHLLRVAGGSPDQVAAAARIAGVSEGTILEAVRFYLQQVLFHEDADAWRVLGLRPGAPEAQAREHHRLLQHWLHPDRRTSDDWETVYATRVNRAWTDIRTGKASAATDQGGDAACGSRHGGDVPSRYSGDLPLPLAVRPTRVSRSKLATLIVLIACLGLLTAIALRNDTPPEWRDPRTLLTQADPAPAAPQERVDLPELAIPFDQLEVEPAHVAVEATMAAIEVPTAPPPQRPARPQALHAATPAAPRAPPAPAPAPPPEPQSDVGDAMAAMSRAATAATTAPVTSDPLPVPPTQQPAATKAPLVQIPDIQTRLTQARTRAHQVTAYLANPTAIPPPVWSNVRILQHAQAQRAQLHQRLGAEQGIAVELLDPQWRLNATGAWLATPYRAARESGRLQIGFTWREDQLLVDAFDLVPDA